MSLLQVDARHHEPLAPPPVERRTSYQEGMYGDAALAASYCGFQKVPDFIPGIWAHGWYPSYREILHPAAITGNIFMTAGDWHWVGRKDHERFLIEFGWTKAKAIGLPVVYLPPRVIPRRPGSLLVMPAHSLDYTSHAWKFEEYAESIERIRGDFSEVVACVHPSCWKHGYWIDAFRRRGIPLVQGAWAEDRNALERMRYLMSIFEYVTTNAFGSQIAYAAYLGAKPSVYGPYAHYQTEDFRNDPLYRSYPNLLDNTLESISEKRLRRECPWLFCHPREAETKIEWGRFEVGEPNRVSPGELRSLFGWDSRTRLVSAVKTLPKRLKHQVHLARDPGFRETERLRTMPLHLSARTSLLGPSLEVPDPRKFLEKKQILFDQELYRFFSTVEAPRILVCGAGIGLSVCYFKKRYPKSKITAFEPDPRTCEFLRTNCESWGASDVQILPTAVWDRETSVPFARGDDGPGRISQVAVWGDPFEVETCRLRTYLTEPVDLLLLNIEGVELDVLLDCRDLLKNVRNLIVHYHSRPNQPQRLDSLMEILTESEFRCSFHAPQMSRSPLLYRQLVRGMDSKLMILANRD